MEYIYEGISLVAIIMGIGELLKLVGFNKKYIPIVNLVVGVVGGVVYLNPTDIKLGVLQGIALGLTSSGLYSSVKNIHEGTKEG